ncbi:MAG TPA: PhnD/SsuA/transferrin family substrate-binding protein [Xanthobacteraceae bacterium]|nr:PhnD/SsuA/transferrin family substrate-binding protein [Xanthobacteraceae bacterium]
MANLQLSLAISSNPRTWPVIDGRVKPDGIDLTITVLGPAEMFWRQLSFAEFDLSEMSMSELMMIRERGDERFVGIPVFTTRRFYHTAMFVHKDARIAGPADLKGKRVGVPEYVQTSALWTRGVLQNEFGIAPRDMAFFMERVPGRSHAGAIGFKAPSGVTISQIPPAQNIGAMMIAGELDACMSYNRKQDDLIDRSDAALEHHPAVRTLFADPAAEADRYYKKTGIYPINHGMVIKRAVFERSPWAVLNILAAFNKANDIADAERREHVAYHLETGLVPPHHRKALATRIVRHGIEANRATLDMAAKFSNQQGLTRRVMTMDELFAPNALGS